MNNVYIRHIGTEDLETTTTPLISKFNRANEGHSEDVKNVMMAVANAIADAGKVHDITRYTDPYRTHLYNDIRDCFEGRLDDLKNGVWYQEHISKERHHLLDRVPEDVNFVDVIEMICDVICTKKERSLEPTIPFISKDVLYAAYVNTFNMINDAVK